MKKALVTGGAGFIGSHLTDRLVKDGFRVVVIDNLSTGRRENLNKKAKFYKIDICSPKIEQIFKKEKPEIVFHLAAQIDVRKSMEDPVADAKVNILGSLNVLECCKKFKCRKIIFASSVGVYGEPQGLPIKEEHLPKPISPYPITKLTIEKYLAYYENQGLRSTSLRFSNIYGPRQSDKGEGGVITIFINKFIRGDRPMIFGDGNQTRDFLYIDDVVDALVLSIEASSGSIYNVGTGKEVTVKCLFKLLNKNLNKKIKPIFKPLRPGEVVRSKVDFSRIEKDLGWRPKYELVVGLKLAIEWFKKDKKN